MTTSPTLYIIDDSENEDNEGYDYIVTQDESGEDEELEVAKFVHESDADEYVAWKNKS